MSKKKSLFITFEGIEGSGKSYQSKILYRKLKKIKIPVILTREPGGTKGAEVIRKIILKDYFEKNKKIKFDKFTDTLLYLAARNEHLKNNLHEYKGPPKKSFDLNKPLQGVIIEISKNCRFSFKYF